MINRLSVALSNISLTTIIQASKSEIGMCIDLGDGLKITLRFRNTIVIASKSFL